MIRSINDIKSTQNKQMTDSSAVDALIRRTTNLDNAKLLQHKTKTDNDTRKSADIICYACGMHGHAWRRCDFCAKIIKSLEFLKGLDSTKKRELLDTFAKEQSRKRSNKMKNRAGHVRLLKADATDVDQLYDLLAELEEEQHNSASDTEQTDA